MIQIVDMVCSMSVGIDIVSLNRVAPFKKHIEKILSEKEIELHNSSVDKDSFIAGRLAAKEAFIKAKKTSILDYKLNKIEVLYDLNGAPELYFEGNKYDVSISHDGGIAIAIVIL